jgi:tRNA threonylcarbamoyladenosine biosynthesis protein TsaB
MLILTIRTDKPEAEIGLFDDKQKSNYEQWQADRQLAETIHLKIDELLKKGDKSLSDLSGLLVFKGPGSFTGLRIGITVANALAVGLDIPIVATEGEEWISIGLDKLLSGDNDKIAVPEYGSLPHITQAKK